VQYTRSRTAYLDTALQRTKPRFLPSTLGIDVLVEPGLLIRSPPLRLLLLDSLVLVDPSVFSLLSSYGFRSSYNSLITLRIGIRISLFRL